MRGTVAIVLLVGILGGCIAPSAPVADLLPHATTSSEPIVVVSLVDSGIDPYHVAFSDPSARLPSNIFNSRTGSPPIPIALSQVGTGSELRHADRAIWESLKTGELYWFEGTRILAMSVRPPNGEALILQDSFHGTAVASAVLSVHDKAWIMMVQMAGENFDGPQVFFDQAGEALTWLSEQPWVDVISMSIGQPANAPGPFWAPLVAGSRAASSAGKLVFAGAGNTVAPTMGSGTNGPPWVVAVGGVQPDQQGEAPDSGKMVDVVSDFTRLVADTLWGREQYRNHSGTSLSSPLVAANAARALWELRRTSTDASGEGTILCRCDGLNLTAQSFREAINRTALYWGHLDYDPLNNVSDPVDRALLLAAPIAPAPWIQMGWGYVGDTTWKAMVDDLRNPSVPPKPAEAQAYMARWQALRTTYWS